MKTFELYLKSYTDMPDFEEVMEAESYTEALDYWYERFAHLGWDRDTIAENMIELDNTGLPINEEENLQEYLNDDLLEAEATGN